jgi:hypothetical protein
LFKSLIEEVKELCHQEAVQFVINFASNKVLDKVYQFGCCRGYSGTQFEGIR